MDVEGARDEETGLTGTHRQLIRREIDRPARDAYRSATMHAFAM